MEGTASNLKIDTIHRYHVTKSLGDLPELDVRDGRAVTWN
jgi:hypothetical protein